MRQLIANGIRPFFTRNWMFLDSGAVTYFFRTSSEYQSLGAYPPHLYKYELIREAVDPVTWVLGYNPDKVFKLKRINKRKKCVTLVG